MRALSQLNALSHPRRPSAAKAAAIGGAFVLLCGSAGWLAFALHHWGVVALMGLGALFGLLLVVGSMATVAKRGVEVRVSVDRIEHVVFPVAPGTSPARRCWSWSEITSAELVDLVFEPVPGKGGGNLEERFVEVRFERGEGFRLPLHWSGAAVVGGSLMRRQFDPSARVRADEQASRTEIRGPG